MSAALPSLDQLQELPLPPAVGYWPQTWGSAVLLAVLLIAVIAGAWRARRQHRRNRYRREALGLLDAIERDTASDPQACRGLPELLKRVGISAAPAKAASVRGLRGQAWVDFMQRTGKQAFPDDAAALLNTLAYAPAPALAKIPQARMQALLAASRHWVEHHHVAA